MVAVRQGVRRGCGRSLVVWPAAKWHATQRVRSLGRQSLTAAQCPNIVHCTAERSVAGCRSGCRPALVAPTPAPVVRSGCSVAQVGARELLPGQVRKGVERQHHLRVADVVLRNEGGVLLEHRAPLCLLLHTREGEGREGKGEGGGWAELWAAVKRFPSGARPTLHCGSCATHRSVMLVGPLVLCQPELKGGSGVGLRGGDVRRWGHALWGMQAFPTSAPSLPHDRTASALHLDSSAWPSL